MRTCVVVGFGVGFAFGFWTGPGAFFTGLATGTGVALLVGSAVNATVVGGLAFFGIFSMSKRIAAADEALTNVIDEAWSGCEPI